MHCSVNSSSSNGCRHEFHPVPRQRAATVGPAGVVLPALPSRVLACRIRPVLPKVSPMKARRGLRAAVDAMCRACIYDPVGGAGTWRQKVQACTSTGCPLFGVRPMAVEDSAFTAHPPTQNSEPEAA
jgi:hypothetical protein